MLYWGGVICTGASAQTKAIEVDASGKMNFYSGGLQLYADAANQNSTEIRFGNKSDWGIEYYYGGLNFFRTNLFGNYVDYQLFMKDNGSIGIGTNDPQSRLQVAGNIKCWGVNSTLFLTLSDKRAKEDIKPINSSAAKLSRLSGVSYKYKKSVFKDIADSLVDEREHFGFLAQELQLEYPELVHVVDSAGTLAIDYIGLIPVLVEALKEQQNQITALTVKEQSNAQLMLRMELLEKQLAQCCPANSAPGKGKLKSGSAESETTAATKTTENIVLFQNTPNPFSTSTEIAMELPADVQDAKLAIYNLAGEQKLSISVAERGAASVRIEAGQLMPGIYIFGIIADGQLAASKQMVVTE